MLEVTAELDAGAKQARRRARALLRSVVNAPADGRERLFGAGPFPPFNPGASGVTPSEEDDHVTTKEGRLPVSSRTGLRRRVGSERADVMAKSERVEG